MYLAVLTWLPGLPSLLHPQVAQGVLEALGVWHPSIVKGMLPVLLVLLLVSSLGQLDLRHMSTHKNADILLKEWTCWLLMLYTHLLPTKRRVH